mmetsp:Transcript_13209/g.38415  ORF Transcript_13209/g.38415 Transcript_13209/m.38415 type:complete len:119 (-) Transcript_13209:255-611(-)
MRLPAHATDKMTVSQGRCVCLQPPQVAVACNHTGGVTPPVCGTPQVPHHLCGVAAVQHHLCTGDVFHVDAPKRVVCAWVAALRACRSRRQAAAAARSAAQQRCRSSGSALCLMVGLPL